MKDLKENQYEYWARKMVGWQCLRAEFYYGSDYDENGNNIGVPDSVEIDLKSGGQYHVSLEEIQEYRDEILKQRARRRDIFKG